ncbi:MAG: hypothetical protein FJZ38_07750 [Candidatus Rokubacteria bacterium]|nr:hypothetical protein [Candidatus Rokubacteria bacterium]
MGVVTSSVGLPFGILAVVLANSVALLADLLRAAAALVAVVLSWLTLRAVRRARPDAFNYGLGKLESSVHDLLDRALEESRQLLIVRVLAQHFDAYEHVREVRSRRSGARIYIEIFLGFDASRTLGGVQRAVDAMRADLEALIAGSSVVIVPAAVRPA